ncbi:MAG: PLDc N-terminal domain-containing protein [Salibacteraceae bacterium]
MPLLLIGPWQLILLLFVAVPFLIALVDIIRHRFQGYYKVIWLLAVLIFPFFGSILYLIFGRSQRIRY